MFDALFCIISGYLIGSIPVAWLAARATGTDLRARGSGNTGASNVIESVSASLGVVVGIIQIAQGLAAVLLAMAIGAGDAVQVAAGVAAVIGNDWSPWLGFRGGRGVGVTIGVLLGVSPPALAAFVVIAVAGRLLHATPQGVALGLLAAPLAAAAGPSAAGVTVLGCAALAAIALLKRITANEPPAPEAPRPDVWLNRLVYDRDIRDRELWVRRGARDDAKETP